MRRYLKKINRRMVLSGVLIFTLALFFRAILLDRIPVGIGNDELDYVLNAKAVWYQFSDVSHTWNPLSLTSVPGETPRGPLPYLLLAPFAGNISSSLFNAKIPYAILSSLFAVVLFAVARELLGNRVGVITGLVTATNPWAIFVGRTAFEAPVALFFYFLAFLIILKTSGKWLLVSLPALFIAFYSYIGLNIIFLPFVTIICFFSWRWQHGRQDLKYFLIIGSVSTIVFTGYLFSLWKNSAVNRVNELAWPTSSFFANEVNYERRASILSSVNPIFSNRYLSAARYVLNKYLDTFSPVILFSGGEPHGLYSLTKHGHYFYSDLIFLLIGAYVLYRTHRKIFFLLSSILIIAPIPAAVSTVNTQYIFRAAMIFPIIIIVLALGLSQIARLPSKRLPLVLIIFAAIYLWEFGNFWQIYLVQNPIYNNSQSAFASRVLARYLIEENRQGHKINVLTLQPRSIFKQFLFYNDLYTPGNASQFSDVFRQGKYVYQNITIGTCEDFSTPLLSSTVVRYYLTTCGKELALPPESLTLPDISDNGQAYFIYGGDTCRQFAPPPFVSGWTMSDFAIENIPLKQFCQKFISSPVISETKAL